MDRLTNPYTPGSGPQPPFLAGREGILDDGRVAIERMKRGLHSQGIVLLGLRGVGKTVLLNRFLGMAENKAILTAKIEAYEGMSLAAGLAPELRQLLYRLDLLAAATHKMKIAANTLRNFIGAFKVRVSDVELGIDVAHGQASSGDIAQDLPTLIVSVSEAAKSADAQIAIFIDEMQYLSVDELTAIAMAMHEVSQRNLPAVFFGAGLPQLSALIGNAREYAERLFLYPEIGPLGEAEAAEAITKPAANLGVQFRPAAVDKILDLSQRYPYFLQVWGQVVWNAAKRSPIQPKDVDFASSAAESYLDTHFFKVRFKRATEVQLKYLRAMAELGPGSQKTGDIAALLGVSSNQANPIRQQLIAKGIIWGPQFGKTEFTVPMFDQFMKRQMPEVERHHPKKRAPK